MWVFGNLLRRQQVAPIVQMLGQKATTECSKLIRKCFKQSELNNNSWLTFSITSEVTLLVATLTFGSRPKQGGCKGAGLIVDPGVTSHAPESAKSVRE